MRSIEKKEERLKHVDMHDYFLDRIKNDMKNGNYIEASWLIYSCLENRYFRTLQKYRDKCDYCRSKSKCNHTLKNELALVTKVKCVKRLYENNVPCIKNCFRYELFDETIKWIEKRNALMHELLSLEYYQDTDNRFEDSAKVGFDILMETYKSCTGFRKAFFDNGYVFDFPKPAMDGCKCKPK